MASKAIKDLQKTFEKLNKRHGTNFQVPENVTSDHTLEAEAVILYYELRGKGFEKQKCPRCGNVFAYKYRYSLRGLHCSNTCRKNALAEIGINWNPYKEPEERWDNAAPTYHNTHGELPIIVPSDVMELVDELLGES